MDREPNNQSDNTLSDMHKESDQREVVTIADMYAQTELADLDSLEVEREKPARPVVAEVWRALVIGVVGSLVASFIFEFALSPVLKGLLG